MPTTRCSHRRLVVRLCASLLLCLPLLVLADDPPPADAAPAPGDTVVKEAPANKAVTTVLQEEHTLFNQPFTLDTGFSYSRYDRRQLILNGFLALDAIFLGNISVDAQKADIFTLDFTGRYSLSQRLQMDVNVPFLYRRTVYQSTGAGGSSSTLSEEAVTMDPPVDVGDVSAGVYYQVRQETTDNPDVVWNLRIKAPTGTNPYGIKTRTDPTNNNLVTPSELPSGNGVWSLSTGFSFVRTVDPAILFANVNYYYNIARKFSDISSDPNTVTAGKVQLGDSLQWGVGMAFALNDKLSASYAFNQRLAMRSSTQAAGQPRARIIGSDANACSLNLGLTYAMSPRLSMVTSVGIGLTNDAPDVIFSMRFPYQFR